MKRNAKNNITKNVIVKALLINQVIEVKTSVPCGCIASCVPRGDTVLSAVVGARAGEAMQSSAGLKGYIISYESNAK